MSRIGKQPIDVPETVTLTQNGQQVHVKGPKGALSFTLPESVTGKLEANQFILSVTRQDNFSHAMWGMSRTMVGNMIVGACEGFNKSLELRGVGYRAQMKGNGLTLQLGYSHEIAYEPPEGISLAVPKPTEIIVSGVDKQKVGQTAAEIRAFRKPEPYKGKGVRYVGEYVRMKEGKKK